MATYTYDYASGYAIPALCRLLRTVPEFGISYPHYALRHPFGLLNTRMMYYHRAIEKVINSIDARDSAAVEDYFRLLVFDLFKYYESFGEIFLAFARPQTPPSAGEFLHRWFSNNGYPEPARFHNSVNPYMTRLRHLYNSLKHTGSEIRLLSVTDRERLSYAYWVESANSAGHVGCFDPDYPRSLYRDLREFIFFTYLFSEQAYPIVVQMYSNLTGADLDETEIPIPDNTAANPLGLLQTIRNLPRFYLPREVGGQYLSIAISANSVTFEERVIEQEMLSSYYHAGSTQIRVGTFGDGVTRSFDLPPIA